MTARPTAEPGEGKKVLTIERLLIGACRSVAAMTSSERSVSSVIGQRSALVAILRGCA
jgi:hypothetical protein